MIDRTSELLNQLMDGDSQIEDGYPVEGLMAEEQAMLMAELDTEEWELDEEEDEEDE